MPFYFKKKEPVAKAVRRLCGERIDAALESLKGRNRRVTVHNVRREIKKLRAVLRLVRDEIGKDIYRRNANSLRTAADRLMAVRDAHARLKAFGALVKHFNGRLPTRAFPKIKQALQRSCRAAERKFFRGDSMAETKRILWKVERRVATLKIKSDGWPVIAPGLKQSFGRGSEALATALSEPSPENFHDWRKRVKSLWYYLRLLHPCRPSKLRAATVELEKLGECLGDDHDLFLLDEFVAAKFRGTKDAEAFKALTGLRQKELRTAALALGARCYSEKPDNFCRRLETYWQVWRKG